MQESLHVGHHTTITFSSQRVKERRRYMRTRVVGGLYQAIGIHSRSIFQAAAQRAKCRLRRSVGRLTLADLCPLVIWGWSVAIDFMTCPPPTLYRVGACPL